VNAVEVDDDPVVRALLAGRDDVASVRPNPELRPIPAAGSAGPASVAGLTGTPANLVAIKAPQAWSQGVNGKGLVVGFSDSGVDVKHPALSSGYRNEWYDPWNHTATPTDRNGHGTHTAAGAVGRGTGVAPGAGWIGCANLARPLGNPAYYVSCLQFMLAPHGDPARGADILSNSWGCPSEEGCAADTLKPAVDALHAAGVFVVGAAGNTGPHCDSITDPPAPYAQTFTVGASNDAGVVTDFSSRGPVSGNAKPDLVAPGEDVLSAWPGGGYKRLSGTSMAAPQVAGVVALMWQAAPSLRGDVTRTASLLRTSAQRASSSKACGGKLRNVVGAGMVDAAAAVTLAKQTAVPAPR
jgi:subtilisin family serine protease